MKMCAAFASHGHEVTLLAPNRDEEAIAGVEDIFDFYGVQRSFTVKKLPYLHPQGNPYRNVMGSVLFGSAIAFELLRLKPELVYGRDFCACATAARLGFRTVFETHAPVHESRLDQFFYRQLLRSANVERFILISHALKRIFTDSFGLAEERILVAHDGADPVSKCGTPPLAGRPGALRAGYIGSLYKGRGINLLLELARRKPDIDFHIIGGSDEDVAARKQQAASTNVHFHGHVPHGEAASYGCQCDILLAPYKTGLTVYGGGADTSSFMSPLKIFEYMSFGKAILTSNLPVLTEVLTEENAVMAKPDDPDEWCNALEELKDSSLRERLGKQALKDFNEKHTWRKRAQTVLQPVLQQTFHQV